MIKNFLLFGGSVYYPCGGWEDFVGSYDTYDEAAAECEQFNDDYRWCHVVNIGTGEIFYPHAAEK